MTPSITLKGEIISFETPKVMGILNVTPDSFYALSRLISSESPPIDKIRLQDKVKEMIEHGVDWLDVGGYSTRPGAPDVEPETELYRLAHALETIRDISEDIPVSVDTFRASVARECILEYGADMINDISGGDLDPEMWPLVAELGVPYIIMHTRGTPQTMQQLTDYGDVAAEVLQDLAFKLAKLRQMGVVDVIVDPGFGFAKTVEGNFRILKCLRAFRDMEAPLLVGLSRKSMIWRTLSSSPDQALNGTTALNMAALINGADILRVHDVKEARECVTLFNMLDQQ